MHEIEVTVECKFCVTRRLSLTDEQFVELEDAAIVPGLEEIKDEMLHDSSLIENPEFDFCVDKVEPGGECFPIITWDGGWRG
ncbi:MAG: hypothetical protein IKZ87_00605 [Actinomycetaceae bacterium]|nr:hypothetical protein [Actinomycetaceae bacterium]